MDDTIPHWVTIELAVLAILVPAICLAIGYVVRHSSKAARFEAWMEQHQEESVELHKQVRSIARDLNRIMGKMGMNGRE